MDANKTLADLPEVLRAPLIEHFREIANNYYERRWVESELNGGKFCEVVYSILDGATSGKFAAPPTKPKNMNMVDACGALRNRQAIPVGDHSIRILIPRAVVFLYDIRNTRNVGHIGGDVDANFMDATAVFQMASWIMAELVRVFHGATTQMAQRAVDALIEFKHPIIWEIGPTLRVQDPRMAMSDQVLVLLYGRPEGVLESSLIASTEYSNASVFRSKVLGKLHASRLIEYDRHAKRAWLSPLGAKEVEVRLLKTRVGV